MPPEKTFSEFRRIPVLRFGFFAGVLLFCAGYFTLFPSDLKTARFFVSRGRVERALAVYNRLLHERLPALERLEVLGEVVQLRRFSGDLPAYLEAVADLAMEGGAGTAVVSDALVCTRALSGEGPEGREASRKAELFRRILAHREAPVEPAGREEGP